MKTKTLDSNKLDIFYNLFSNLPVLSWRVWWGIALLGVFLYVASNMLAGFTLPLGSSFGLDAKALAPVQHIITITLTILTLFIFNKRVSRKDFALEKFDFKKILILSLIGFAIVYGINKLAIYFNPSLLEASEKVSADFEMGKSFWIDIITVLCVASLGPIAEEFVFRGLVFRSIRDRIAKLKKFSSENYLKYISVLLATLLSSFFFLMIHGGEGQEAQLSTMFLIACVFGLSYAISGSLYVPIFIHSISNSYAIYFIAQKYSSTLGTNMVYLFTIICPIISLLISYLISRILPAEKNV